MTIPKHFIIKIESPTGESISKYEVASHGGKTAVLGDIAGKHQMMELPVSGLKMNTLLATIFMAILNAESGG